MSTKSTKTVIIGNIQMSGEIYEALQTVKELGNHGNGGSTGKVAANYADSALYYCQNQIDFNNLCAYVLSNMFTMRGEEIKKIRKLLKTLLKENR